MPTLRDRKWLAIFAIFTGLYLTALLLRPALPIDETRYLTVAWEMWLRGDWLAPLTVNFEPYHHKPPLLFWLINASWSMFGVSRWAALLPIVLAALATVFLTGTLCKRIFPELQSRSQLVLIGCLAFLGYSTLLLFDLTLTVFVTAALVVVVVHSRSPRNSHLLLLGLLLGLGVLTKGPVAYLYVLFPILLAPFWTEKPVDKKRWYFGHLVAFLISLVPVLLWLVPVLQASSGEFGYWLVWEQTAGRVTGSYGSSHPRPVYFYLLILPIMLAPWVFFASFWKGLVRIPRNFGQKSAVRFLVIVIVPTLVVFSVISGKQPHYLVPLLPGMAILVAHMFSNVPARLMRIAAAAMVVVFIGGHVLASRVIHETQDLKPFAEFIRLNDDRPLAFAGGHYRGELTYLAGLREPVDTLRVEQLDDWFAAHPGGLAIVRYGSSDELIDYEMLMTHPYRRRHLGIVTDARGAMTVNEPARIERTW